MAKLLLTTIFTLLFLAGCVQPAKKKKRTCDDPLFGRMMAGASQQDKKEFCHQAHFFQCDIRIFSPEVEDGKEIKQVCLNDNENPDDCLMAQLFYFSTEEQKSSDPHSKAEDFLPGGQYNYQEVSCYQKYNHAEGLYQYVGEGSSIEQALEMAQNNCQRKNIIKGQQ